MKKTVITLLLVFALGSHAPRAKASVFLGGCYVVGIGVGIGTVIYLAKRCGKKFYCVHANEDTESPLSRKCIKTTPREMRLNDMTPLCGPFDNAAACFEPCDQYTNGAPAAVSFADEEETPLTVIVQVSTNLIYWTDVATNYFTQLYFDTDTVVYEHTITNAPAAQFARLLVFE